MQCIVAKSLSRRVSCVQVYRLCITGVCQAGSAIQSLFTSRACPFTSRACLSLFRLLRLLNLRRNASCGSTG